jgi:prevent-host-death family protein
MEWQVQEAKQRFSELVQRALDEGPQIVTRHGKPAVAVIDIAEYRRLRGVPVSFKEMLLGGPFSDELAEELEHVRDPTDTGREIEL